MNCSRHLKQKVKVAIWWMFCGFCFGITPHMFLVADLERGYNATGGEIFVPLIPFITFFLSKFIKELLTYDQMQEHLPGR